MALASGCANQGFRLTGTTELSPTAMQNLVLRSSCKESIEDKVPPFVIQDLEDEFLAIKDKKAKAIGLEADVKPTGEYYYLAMEISKYKPGSPTLRKIITPVVFFGLGGSYVNVDYAVYPASGDKPLGRGKIRKANLFGGQLGETVTAATQIKDCSREIMTALDMHMKQAAK